MEWFKPTAESVSFAAEICLTFVFLLYYLSLRPRVKDTRLLIGITAFSIVVQALTFFDTCNISAVLGIYEPFILEVSRDALFLYFLWFSYKFSENCFPKEMVIVMIVTITAVCCSLFPWFRFFITKQPPSALHGLVLICMNVIAYLYSSLIFLRKIKNVYRRKKQQANSLKAGSSVTSATFVIPEIFSAEKKIRAFRGLSIAMFLFSLIWLLFLLTIVGIISLFMWHYSFHILLLLITTLVGFTYLNYASEPVSFQAKLIAIVLCVVLTILGLLPYSLFGEVSRSSSGYPERSLKGFLLLIPVVTLVIVIILPLVFRYNILQPLEKIMEGVKKVNAGDLSTDITIEVNDEIGILSNNFNQMIQSLRQYSNKMNDLVEARTTKLNKSLEDLKSAQAQLIQSEKMASLGELTAGIAHEIQNPLNFVNNFSDVNTELIDELEEEAKTGNMEEVKALAIDIRVNEQKINHHGRRADAIVKGMLQHSRANTGKKEPTDINALADEYLRLAYHGLRAKDKHFNADFKTDFDESIEKINAVSQDIGRVLLNLYNNAFYAVNEKKRQLNGTYEPTVTVTTKRTGDKVEIVVKDNGSGIPQKVVDKIFQPFFTTKPTGEGTGLGLSLAYDIIKAHGGELKVESKEGEGAEFIIQVPLT